MSVIFALAALAIAPAPRQSHVLGPPASTETFPFDNVAGRLVNFGTAALDPLEISRDGAVLYALNQPGAHLAMLDPTTLARVGDVQIGIGAVSVMMRPGTTELWVVDSVDSCVSVVDTSLRAIVRTIRVGGEPYGIAFPPSGDRAYVTCSGVDRVDVIDAASYRVVKSIPIPAHNPRGIVYLQDRAYVVALLSGNGTAPMGNPSDPYDVAAIGVPGPPTSNALPDRDLFVIPTRPTPEADDLDPTATVTGLGTILFNVHLRPGTSELWIPNTEGLNAVHRGEVNFVAGQVVQNRITIVDATGAAPPRVIDLDAIAPSDKKCAQPTYVEFDPARPRAYVCGYGSDLVAVLGLGSGGAVTWEGSIELPPSVDHFRGTGPRACRVLPAHDALVVYNTNDASATEIDLAGLPSGSGWSLTASSAVKLGVDLTSLFEHLGRHVFTNANLSLSKTSSCASCHVDGHTDGLVWDLSHFLDPEGTPNDQLHCGTDVKGPMVTQSVRRMEESGPYHWRGEIAGIGGFQGAFVNLLEHTVNGTLTGIGADFQYMLLFVDRLAWPPNPREPLDRRFTGDQRRGVGVFTSRPVQGNLTCASCHALPLGASGEIVVETAGGVIRSADVPGMRGVGDKQSPSIDLGGPYGERSERGAGFTHAGAAAGLKDAFQNTMPLGSGYHNFALTSREAVQLGSFLSAFDTGIAPAAGYMVTADASNWASVAAHDLPVLRAAAARGDCDLVYHRVPRFYLGQWVELSGAYDPVARNYRVASAAAGRIDESTLLAEARTGLPVTFLGVPVGMGESQGLDRDMDGLLDLDELTAGTDSEVPDTDGDGFSDGYEVAWGMDPLHATASSPDTQPPSLVGPVRLLYATMNTLKFEFETSEFCRVTIAYDNQPPVMRIPFNQIGDHHHWYVLNGLQQDTDYRIVLEMRDSAGNVAVDSTAVFRTRPRATPEPVFVDTIALTTVPIGGSTQLQATVGLKIGAAPAVAGYRVSAAVYQVAFDGSLHVISNSVSGITDATGSALLSVNLPAAGPSPGTLYFVVKDVREPLGGTAYARGLNHTTVQTIAY